MTMTQPQWETTAPTTPPTFDTIEPQTPPPAPKLLRCPVPGCDYTTAHQNSLGPHVAMHRRHGDPGTPPPRWPSKAKGVKPGRKSGTAQTAAPKPPKPKPQLTPADVVDGVLNVLFPNSVPTARVRQVAVWIEQTERLAADAFADQATPTP